MSKHSFKTKTSAWIICTKWVIRVPKIVPDKSEIEDRPVNKVEFDTITKYMPIGTPEYAIKKGKISGIPFSYATQKEAEEALREVVKLKGDSVSGLIFSLLEVKYVPVKIKAFDQAWYNKRVIKEITFETKENKTLDVFKDKEI